MDEITIAALCAGVASCVITILFTRMTESLDAIASGVLGTLPTSIVPASFVFMCVDPDIDVVDALYVVPSAIFLNALFLFVWKLIPRRLGRKLSLSWVILLTVLMSLVVWGIEGVGLFFLLNPVQIDNKRIVAAVSTLLMLIFGLILAILQPIPSSENESKIIHPPLYVLLGSLSFASTAISVVVAAQHEVASGLICTFPAIFSIKMISNWMFQGTKTAGKELITTTSNHLYIANMILGSVSTSFYSIVFATVYEFEVFDEFDTWPGYLLTVGLTCLGSILVSLIFVSLPVILLLKYIEWRATKKLLVIPEVSEDDPLLSHEYRN